MHPQRPFLMCLYAIALIVFGIVCAIYPDRIQTIGLRLSGRPHSAFAKWRWKLNRSGFALLNIRVCSIGFILMGVLMILGFFLSHHPVPMEH